MIPAMTAAEIELLRAMLRPASIYVEFGCGGSTFVAADLVGKFIVSVDSSQDWLRAVAQSCTEADKPLLPTAHFVDIGPIKEFGWPADESARDRWPEYHSSIWRVWPEARQADVFLIDGRFRVACFLQSLLNARQDRVFLIHDYFSRPHYHVVADFGRLIARADDIAAFVRRDSFPEAACREAVARYAFVAD
jgi:hypothetical protein